jgi:VWFA-related protein
LKKFRAFLFLLIFLIPFAAAAFASPVFQDNPPLSLEITGVDVSEMPTVTVTANVYDALGLPLLGLSEENFALQGDLSGVGSITSVENVTDNNLPIATVLLIDVSTSMTGTPIENAKLAAQAFVDNIGPNDPVAIMTFGSSVRVLQDYTTDKAVLTAAIASLQEGGETALYQGAYDAINLAAQSPTLRHAVILLSDGAEYGDASDVPREAAAEAAGAQGVPVYSIGLGYGIDRTFLQELSAATSSQFYESPTPEQLTEIYTNLAAQLRSQYIITLDVPVPLDGTQYTLQLEATTDAGSATASAVLRAPIPVPIPSLPTFDAPLTEPTEITATVLADDPIESVTFRFGGNEPIATDADAPTITIDPVEFPPGDYPLIVTALDENGDEGAAGIQLSIGALPSEIALNPDFDSLPAVVEPRAISIETSGQTPATTASVAFNDGESTSLTQPFGFMVDPLDFAPGANTVTVSVTNEGGVTSEATFDFFVAEIPPQIAVVGLEDGQSIDEPTEFTVEVVAQGSVEDINVSVNEQVLEPNDEGVYTLDPINFRPGVNTVVVSATAANGRVGLEQIDIVIAALPPQIIVEGLEAGETITGDRELSFDFVTQSPVMHLALFLDGVDLAHLVTPPFGFTLRVLDFEPGEHVLRVIADNSDRQSGTLEIPFSIAEAPAASATALAVMTTRDALATATQQAQASATAIEATQAAVATGTQAAVEAATEAVQMTQLANSAATKAVLDATATQIKVEGTATHVAVVTQAAQEAALNAQATETDIAQNTQAAVELATQNAQASATAAASATQNAVIAQATQAVQETQSAQVTATQLANRLATLNAQITATAVAQATTTQVAQGTQNAQSTATQVAEASSTAAAEAQTVVQAATRDAEATEQATLDAQATQNAQVIATRRANATATGEVNATVTAEQATEAAQATATQQAQATATAFANATATAEQATREIEDATATAVSLEDTATQAAAATLSALEATATQIIVNATATRNALETQTANNATATQAAVNATATITAEQALVALATADTVSTRNAVATSERAAQITVTAQRLADLASATANANATATAALVLTEAQATQDVGDTATAIAEATRDTRLTAVGPTATSTEVDTQDAALLTPSPQATLTEVQAAQAAGSNITPIAIILIVIIIVIIILVLIMRGRGSSSTRR